MSKYIESVIALVELQPTDVCYIQHPVNAIRNKTAEAFCGSEWICSECIFNRSTDTDNVAVLLKEKYLGNLNE